MKITVVNTKNFQIIHLCRLAPYLEKDGNTADLLEFRESEDDIHHEFRCRSCRETFLIYGCDG